MRSKKDIEKDIHGINIVVRDDAIAELLLDIRELLRKKVE